jgi:hypothetical protein
MLSRSQLAMVALRYPREFFGGFQLSTDMRGIRPEQECGGHSIPSQAFLSPLALSIVRSSWQPNCPCQSAMATPNTSGQNLVPPASYELGNSISRTLSLLGLRSARSFVGGVEGVFPEPKSVVANLSILRRHHIRRNPDATSHTFFQPRDVA